MIQWIDFLCFLAKSTFLKTKNIDFLTCLWKIEPPDWKGQKKAKRPNAFLHSQTYSKKPNWQPWIHTDLISGRMFRFQPKLVHSFINEFSFCTWWLTSHRNIWAHIIPRNSHLQGPFRSMLSFTIIGDGLFGENVICDTGLEVDLDAVELLPDGAEKHRKFVHTVNCSSRTQFLKNC